MQLESPNLMSKCATMSHVTLYIGVISSKVGAEKASLVSVLRWNATLPFAAYVSYTGFEILRSVCMSVCLFVCTLAYLKNRLSKFHKIVPHVAKLARYMLSSCPSVRPFVTSREFYEDR